MPENTINGNRPWLIAAWPGMGNVAVIAAGYLVQKLGMKPVAELPPHGHFDIQQVTAHDGLISPPRMPRSILYGWKNPSSESGGHDLLVSISEAQPANGTYAFANELLERVAKMGVERVFTFASLASQLHPSSDPRVFGAATNAPTLNELKQLEVEALKDGQIGGLNGVMLGAALEHSVHGACLLGEIPFFAVGVPNPKAARAVLDVFCTLAGVKVDFAELDKHGEAVERVLTESLERMREQGLQWSEQESAENGQEAEEEPGEATEAAAEPEPKLDFETRSRIEELFDQARKDRSRAVALKTELDRLSVFGQYEDRFLDLFRRAD